MLVVALLGGLGGGITRDVLLGDVPSAITNPACVTLALAFAVLGYSLAYARGQLFREGLLQFMTSFSLPWYAIVGARKGNGQGIPVVGCLLGRRKHVGGSGRGVPGRLRDPRRRPLYASEEPLASEPADVYQHSDGRPMLGRRLHNKSQRELRDLGLVVDDESTVKEAASVETTT